MSNVPKKSRRRYLQFSLRTLLILVTLVVGLLVAWRVYYVEPYRQQRETMKLIEELGGSYKTEPGGPACNCNARMPDATAFLLPSIVSDITTSLILWIMWLPLAMM